MAKIHRLFEYMTRLDASDLHLASFQRPALRINGEVVEIDKLEPLADDVLRSVMKEIVSEAQWATFEEERDLDFACSVEGFGRFRANYFVQHTGAGAVFRRIPERIQPIEELGLPDVVGRLAELRSGLVLVTGPTGSGKSTTLAAIIDRMNRSSSRHIVTVEDPVEFVHQNQRSVITQREVGTDAKSFSEGLRSALHQDADVVLVGEMRDLETISLAVTAANMGVLILATLHTSSAAKTIDRIIDAFPADQQPQVRHTLAESLVAVVSQILVKRSDGTGRVACHEVLLRTSAVPSAVREGNVAMLASIIGSGKRVGMQSMDDTLMAAVESGAISGHDAYMKAQDKKRFQNLADDTAALPGAQA